MGHYWSEMQPDSFEPAKAPQGEQVDWNTPVIVSKVERQSLGVRQDRLMGVLAVLSDLLDKLEAKLEPVLGPELAETKPNVPQPPPEEISPLGACLHSIAVDAARLTRRVSTLIDRVDL